MRTYDVAVAGLGAIGGAAAHRLAVRGAKVLAIDRFAPPHDRGSSHGESRITRLAIGEGEHFTPLALRARTLWREAEAETGTPLLEITGGLIVSSTARTGITHVENFFANTVSTAKKHCIAHEILDAAEIRRRFPAFDISEDERGYYEPEAGYLRPEACVRAQLELAERSGAQLRTNETVLRFDATAGGVRVTTDRGAYAAGHLVLAAGAWLPDLLGAGLSRHFHVFRQVQFWFAPQDPISLFEPPRFPVFIWELQGKAQSIYGFPAIDGAVKVATEQYAQAATAETALREATSEEAAAMHGTYVAPYLRGLSGTCLRAAPCLYTVTPDFGFVVDRHPESPRVIVASCCSGHGFKHAPAIGEAIAGLVLDGESGLNAAAFGMDRLLRPSAVAS